MRRRDGRRASVRLRITAGALVVVVAAFVAAGFVLIGVVERAMFDQIDSTLKANAEFLERSLRSGAPLPTGEGPTDLYVQFVTAEGDVIGASTAAGDRPALVRPDDARIGRIVTIDRAPWGHVRVLALRSPIDPSLTLVVARSSDSVATVRDSLRSWLVGLVAAGSLLLGVVIWVVVGRALRPVEAMRETVDAISERDLGQRLRAPGTGDELDRLAATLNDLLTRLDAAVTRERRFVADASHELRTPIAGVRALLETESADPASVLAVRTEALARLRELEDLVEELLELAESEDAGRARPARFVDLDELVLAQADQLRRTTALQIDTAQVSGGQIMGHDTALSRVVENLATNAVRHARTTVAFAVRQVDDEVEVSVSDDGAGIAPEDRPRIFERFTTLDDARTGGNGRVGLGLSIAAAIVSAHRGSIRAEEAAQGGARFVVRLPVGTDQ